MSALGGIADFVTTTEAVSMTGVNQMDEYLREVGKGRADTRNTPKEVASQNVAMAQLVQLERLLLPLSVLAVEGQLESLPDSEDIEVKPTNWARFYAKRTVIPAFAAISKDRQIQVLLPSPTIGTDDAGGIMVSWVLGEKYLLANFGATTQSKSFIYFEEGTPLLYAELHDVEVLDDAHLSNRLRWLVAQ